MANAKTLKSATVDEDSTITKGLPAWEGDLSWDDNAEVDVFDGGPGVVKKQQLLGHAFLIGGVNFRKGDFGNYAAARCVNKANEEFIFNDGSTGVYRQLVDYVKSKGLTSSDAPEGTYAVRLMVKNGLRVSTYEGPQGKQASTYYLA